MTKQEFEKLFNSAINGRNGFSLVYTGEGEVRCYSSEDIFTATFISDVLRMTGDYFTGITNDINGSPYMLFNY